jgi:hypothetical protein
VYVFQVLFLGHRRIGVFGSWLDTIYHDRSMLGRLHVHALTPPAGVKYIYMKGFKNRFGNCDLT